MFYQMIIGTTLFCQSLMVTRLYYLSLIQNNNLVSISYRTKSVSNNYNCAALIEPVQVLYNHPLIIGIQRISSLIQKDIIRIFIHSPCYQNMLLLPLTQSNAVTAYLCIVF